MIDRIYVTGGAGFIGSHLNAVLRAWMPQTTLVCMDRNASAAESQWDHHRMRDLRYQDTFDAEDLVPGSVVVHLAADPGVRGGGGAAVAFEHNFMATVNVADWCLANGCRRLVFASSGAVHSVGTAYSSAYAVAKQASEGYLRVLRNAGLEVSILRFSNVYGYQRKPKAAVGRFCQALLTAAAPIINGDGYQSRDLIHVSDVCHAIVRAITNEQPCDANICTGVQTDILSLWEQLRAVAESSMLPIFSPHAFAGAPSNPMTPGGLPWEPLVSLDDGLRDTYQDFKNRGWDGRPA